MVRNQERANRPPAASPRRVVTMRLNYRMYAGYQPSFLGCCVDRTFVVGRAPYETSAARKSGRFQILGPIVRIS
jgi:hypothetical protein